MKDKSVLIIHSAEGSESGQPEDDQSVVADQTGSEVLETAALAKMELAIRSNKNEQRLEVFIGVGKYFPLIQCCSIPMLVLPKQASFCCKSCQPHQDCSS